MGARPHLAESARKVTTRLRSFHRVILSAPGTAGSRSARAIQSLAERGDMLAFSFWEAIWLIFITFVFITVLMMLFSVIVDLFRDHELSGWGKTGWIILLIVLPLLGLLIYVIARGKG